MPVASREVVVIASDHNGVDLKAKLVEELSDVVDFVDLGPNGLAKVDYTSYAEQVGQIVANEGRKGVLICGTGVGMSIAANKVAGVRAALVESVDVARLTREHNDSNILCLGAWMHEPSSMVEVAREWLQGSFGKGRHLKRVAKIAKKKNIAVVPGVFDIVHPGHVKLIEYAASVAEHVIVLLDTDERVEKRKGKPPFNPLDMREQVVSHLWHVEEVELVRDDESIGDIIEDWHDAVVVKGGKIGDEAKIAEVDEIPKKVRIDVVPIDARYSTKRIKESLK